MISYISGILEETEENLIVVEAGGIGYNINVPSTVLSELPPKGTDVRIYTYFSVKEDSQSLYGFLYKEDREMFKMLISVNGVGPKGALAILSVLRPDDLRMAIITGDAKSISRAQGIGTRTAERVILDLRGKIGDISGISVRGIAADGRGSIQQNTPNVSAGPVSEAIDALTMLGYSRIEAGKAVGAVELTDKMTTEDVLKLALKKIR